MKDRRPAKTVIQFLGKNGTSVKAESPHTMLEMEELLRTADGGWIVFDLFEKDDKIASGKSRVDLGEVTCINIFEINDSAIVTLK